MTGVLLTSTSETSAGLMPDIEAMGFEVFCAPMLEIKPLNTCTPDPGKYAGLIFTSANAVRIISRNHQNLPKGLPVYVGGPQTKEAAVKAGFEDVVQVEGGSRGIVRYFETRTEAGTLLHIRGNDVACPVAETLTNAGFKADNFVVYEAVPVTEFPEETMAAICNDSISHTLFLSARAGSNFAALVDDLGLGERLRAINALCLSVRVLKSIDVLPWAMTYVASRPDRESLLELLNDPGGKD